MTLPQLIESITPLNDDAVKKATDRLNQLTKPPGSLGILEGIAAQIAGIKGTSAPKLGKKAIVVMAADHGVCAEGVSAFPQEVTVQMVHNILQGGAAVNVLGRHAGADVLCVDIGVKGDVDHHDLISKKIRRGSGNMRREQAMTRAEAEQAIMIGADIVKKLHAEGCGMIGTGEMGIGNTTPSAAILTVLAGVSLEESVGKGTGIDDDTLAHKRQVIQDAIALHRPNPAEPMEVLAALGGLEIAGLTGVILQAAALRMPVMIDGFISSAAALIAARLAPLARDYMIASHQSDEHGHRHMLAAIGLTPMLHMHMRLGEGTGAALAMPMVEASLKIMDEMATFESAGISSSGDHSV